MPKTRITVHNIMHDGVQFRMNIEHKKDGPRIWIYQEIWESVGMARTQEEAEALMDTHLQELRALRAVTCPVCLAAPGMKEGLGVDVNAIALGSDVDTSTWCDMHRRMAR